jgi:hypothetical protein
MTRGHSPLERADGCERYHGLSLVHHGSLGQAQLRSLCPD